MGERRNRFEVWAEGLDDGLQGVGSDPYGGPAAYTGLRVPKLATPDNAHRYLFMLCGFGLGERAKATIRSWRQLLTLGFEAGIGGSSAVLIEKEVESPVFRFPDGNVSYHLTRIDEDALTGNVVGTPPTTGSRIPVNNLAWRMATSSALLYESVALRGSGFYTDLTMYVPPNQGKPYGDPVAHMKVIHDRRADWRAASAWQPLDLEVEGPGFYALWASVYQTSGLFNLGSLATTIDTVQAGLSDYQFMAAFPPGGEEPTPTVQYWRVGGALDVFIHEDGSDTTCRSGR